MLIMNTLVVSTNDNSPIHNDLSLGRASELVSNCQTIQNNTLRWSEWAVTHFNSIQLGKIDLIIE